MNTFSRFFIVAISLLAPDVGAACTGASEASPLYCVNTPGDHFYTPDLAEYTSTVANNGASSAEGIRALVFTTQVANSVRLLRLWNGEISDHFYTTNATEAVGAAGYVNEEQAPMYIYQTQMCGSVPFYRSFSIDNTDHFYSVNETEHDSAVALGYEYELIQGYVFPPPGFESPTTTSTEPTASESSTPNPKKSLPAGSIVAITLSIIASLLLGISLWIIWIRKSRRAADPELEAHSYPLLAQRDDSSSVSEKTRPSANASSAVTGSSRSVSISQGTQTRQEYLTAQLRTIQRQLQSRLSAVTGGSSGLDESMEQNDVLRARITALERELELHHPPPGYLD
ncbi:hypothetical protein B0H17DRAFT_1184670 [Mycena rosella]|uniref:DUF5648 domain-containing protein n=1 Tax=Mycena rosella TaxID=1033263 RepID=A0AAD7G7L4_MYCRO|nr:hypothetical protein B0H17DRAFT_1184670 [Mycena rosella]